MAADFSCGEIALSFGLVAFALPLASPLALPLIVDRGVDRRGESREEEEEFEVEGGDDRDEADEGEGSIEGVISGSGSRLTVTLCWSADVV